MDEELRYKIRKWTFIVTCALSSVLFLMAASPIQSELRPQPKSGTEVAMAPYDFSNEARETDEELAEELSKLTALSDQKISELLPKRVDQEELKGLIADANAEEL